MVINTEQNKVSVLKNTETVKTELEFIKERTYKNLEVFKGKTLPKHSSQNNVYAVDTNHDWTAGFWCGILWLMYEYTDDEIFKERALVQCEGFKERMDNCVQVDCHDVGFLYTLSCVAGYKFTGDEELKKYALMAADVQVTRYRENGGYIQSWGDNGDKDFCMLIIDSMMNLPILFWAYEVTGEKKYYDIAVNHANACAKNILRDDNSTFHTYWFDEKTGAPLCGKTAQGKSDSSIWARGQAWAIYGFSLAYRYTKNEEYMEISKKTLEYFLNNQRSDNLCYWDLTFKEPCDEPLDSSASAIAVCGMLDEMQNLGTDDLYGTIQEILESLAENCSGRLDGNSNGLLLHSVYSIPHGQGIDECCLWGDYFYAESLLRIYKDNKWNLYW